MLELLLGPEATALAQRYDRVVGELGRSPTPTLVGEAIVLMSELLDRADLSAEAVEIFKPELGRRLLDRLRIPGAGGDPIADVSRAHRLIDEAARGRAWPASFLVEVGDGYYRRYLLTRDPGDAATASSMLREGLQRLPAAEPVRAVFVNSLLVLRKEVWDHNRAPADLEQAIDAVRFVLGLSHLPPDEEASALNRYAARLRERFEMHGDAADLDQALDLQRQALARATPSWGGRSQLVDRLIEQLMDQAERDGRDDRLMEAIEVLWSETVDPEVLSWRGVVERRLFETTGSVERLDAAVQCQEEALAAPDLNAGRIVIYSIRAANARCDRYRSTGEESDLQWAMEHADRAVACLGSEQAGAVACRALNARAYTALLEFERDGDRRLLDQALSDWEAAADAGRSDPGKDLVIGLTNWADAMIRHVHAAGGLDDLERPIAMLRKALRFATGTLERARTLNTLGLALRYRYESARRTEDLAEAVSVTSEALRITPGGSRSRSVRLDNLATLLLLKSGVSTDPALVSRAVALRREAVSRQPVGSHDRPNAIVNLVGSLIESFYASGDAEALKEAEGLLATQVASATLPAQWKIPFLIESSVVLLALEAAGGRIQLLDEAGRRLTEALGLAPKASPLRTPILINLALVLQRQGTSGRSPALVDKAIELLSDLLGESSANDPRLPEAEGALATAYWVKGTVTRNAALLKLAESLAAASLERFTAGTLDWAMAALRLGDIWRSSHDLVPQPEIQAKCQSLLELVLAESLVPALQVRAARSLGEWAERGPSPDSERAARAYEKGLEAVDRLFSRQLIRPHREAALRDSADLVTRAAATLVASGRPDRAVAVLEAGRTLLASAAFRTAASRLEGLASAGHPDLLARYTEASEPIGAIEAEMASHQPGSTRRLDAANRLRAAQSQLDLVLVDIRRVDGFAEFPRAGFPSAAELANLAAPLVFLIPGLHRGAAVRVDADGSLEAALLPGATDAALTDRVASWQKAAARWDGSSRQIEVWTAEVLSMGGWLWTHAMEAVTGLLQETAEVILVPCGGFVDLPLHAAWRPDGDHRRYLLDDVVVRYAPNLRTALETKRRAAGLGATNLLAVADASLAWALPEVTAVASHFGADGSTNLLKSVVTRQKLLDTLASADVAHFACHGRADPVNPLAGALYACCDAPVSLADISGLKLDATRMVALSACQSAVSDPRLLNEVVNLATGFLEVGAAGALGSLWTVDDQMTAILMGDFYKHWKVDGLSPAHSLTEAQREMRSRLEDEPVYWAPFVYLGS